MTDRETWASHLGFILAAVGSAVGLGNIWRFPWLTAENGGSAFLVLYLGLVILVGVPGLLVEFVIGRRSKRNPVGAFRSLSGSRWWPALGAFNVASALVVLSFYSVVGGWTFRYVAASVAGSYFGAPAAYFDGAGFGVPSAAFGLLFLLVVGGIVLLGVERGIEASAKVMMPAIVLLLAGLALWASTRSGAGAGYEFYLSFDWAYLRENFFEILGPAAGQALFTLSVGVGVMITYASYLDRDLSLPRDALVIAVSNTFVGFLTGLVVFPLLFSLGIDPTETGTGAGALFVSLAGAFASLPAGRLIGVVFFAIVALAALSSAISMLEVTVSFLVDEFDLPRTLATAGAVATVAVVACAAALAPALFTFLAGTLADLLLTAGLLGFAVFVVAVLGRDAVEEYGLGAGSTLRAFGRPWFSVVAWLLPALLLFTFVNGVAAAASVEIDALWAAAFAAAGAAALRLLGGRAPVGGAPEDG